MSFNFLFRNSYYSCNIHGSPKLMFERVRLPPAVIELASLVEHIPRCRQDYAKGNDYEQRQEERIARIIEEP